jgi:putative transposase
MSWRTTCPMNERARFIFHLETGLYTITELCHRYGVSRKTAYKWIGRYHEYGLTALDDQPRIPAGCPHRLSDSLATALVQCRRDHPTWGPRKLVAYLARQHPDSHWPAPSTVGDLLKREGLVRPRRRRTRHAHPGKPHVVPQGPNDIWAADFKGEFKTLDGLYCYPLTVTDLASRFLLACVALPSVRRLEAQPVFEKLFQVYGLPNRILTDNGSPFASTRAIGGLSQLAVSWLKLGIQPVRIEPGRPDQNGKHERMHRTLKAEATTPPKANLALQQLEFDRFRYVFNQERPHDALDSDTPAMRYQVMDRRDVQEVPPVRYPAHFIVRRVSGNSGFRWKSQFVFVSQTLMGEHVGLEEVNDGIWSVWFRDFLIGRFNEHDPKRKVL